MRGGDVRSGDLFSYVDLEDRVRGDHPLRTIRQIVNEALVLLEREFAELSTDHFSVDGTLIQAWASMKSVKPKDGSRGDRDEPPADRGGRNADADFQGERCFNDTHASTTDPDARLYKKVEGKEAKLCFMGHSLMENRHGLLVDACLTEASGHAERVAALYIIEPRADRPRALTLGAAKAYDTQDFVN